MEITTDNIISVISLLVSSGAIGGLIFLKSKRRKAAAEAGEAELNNEMKRTDWLEARIKERDDKVNSLYKELREEQRAHLETIRGKHQIELVCKDLEYDKCKRDMCPHRIPPRKDEVAITDSIDPGFYQKFKKNEEHITKQ